jgi:inner membrane protein
MDLLTQGLLGASVAQSASAGKDARVAAAVGMVAGLLPDVDVLITSASDPLLFLDFHRHFTHALVAVPVLALLAGLVVWPFVRKRLGFGRTYVYALLGCAFAGVLDACTSYGTHLFWPFTDQALALSIVSIVDPVVSVLLAVGLLFGLRSRRRRPSAVALLLVVAYLGAGLAQHDRAQAAAAQLAASRGHTPERALVKPTLAHIVLWRSLYTLDGRIYADAVRVSPFGGVVVYPGESVRLIDANAVLRADDPAASLEPELARFSRFASGLLVRHPQRAEMIGDARFAMSPTSLRPLWGIVPAPATAGYPADFVSDRTMSAAERERFLDMLLGRAPQ